MPYKEQTVHDLVAVLDAYQEIICSRGVGYIKLTPEERSKLTPDERAAWDKAQARRRQQRSQRTIPKDQ